MSSSAAFSGRHYTLERDGRELQRHVAVLDVGLDYTLERDGRELQRLERRHRDFRIIPLREMEGNYNITEEKESE